MNPIDKIQLNKEYKSGPHASTDLHAGGIFFCVPYEDIITFFENGKVEIKKRVIETFRPMDGQYDIDAINHFKLTGTYELSDRGYINCTFEGFTMVGLPLEINQDILVFHCYHKIKGQQFGNAFKRSTEIKK